MNPTYRVIKEFVPENDGWNRVTTTFEVRDGNGWRRARPDEAGEIDQRMRSRRTVSTVG